MKRVHSGKRQPPVKRVTRFSHQLGRSVKSHAFFHRKPAITGFWRFILECNELSRRLFTLLVGTARRYSGGKISAALLNCVLREVCGQHAGRGGLRTST